MKKIAAMLALLVLLAVLPVVSAVQAGEKQTQKAEVIEKDVLENIQNLPGIDKDSIQKEFETSSFENAIMSQSMSSTGYSGYCWKPKLIHFSFLMKNNDGLLPTKIDVWVNLRNYNYKKTKVDYLSPGSGLNVDANFNTNPVKTLIESRLLEEGYFMVVGINPPEASYNPENPRYSEEALKNYGMPSHVKEARKVIELFQSVGFDYDYEIEGHSAGALVAALVAVEIGDSDSRFKGLTIHDVALQFNQSTVQAEYATASYNAVANLFENGVYEYSNFTQYKKLANTIRAGYGSADSGVARGDPLPGNFTVEGLFYFASIHTGWMPGPVTAVTGLPDSWAFGNGGYLAGDYQFMPDPADDVYSFSLTKIETMFEALDKIKYGAYPTAFERDIMAVWAGINPMDWDNISSQVKISWRNDECGFGDVSQIDKAYEILSGRPGFSYNVRTGFCHADETFANSAFK